MPVSIETIKSPEQQDYDDLLKVYQDAPNWMLKERTPEELLAELLDEKNYILKAARFNDRLLGALSLRIQKPGLRVEHLVVRKVTRRRGVASRLLESVISVEERPLKFKVVQNTTTDLLLDKMGWVKKDKQDDGRYLWVVE